MYYRIIRNDILKSKLITLTTMIFVTAAAMLVTHDAKVAAQTERIMFMRDGVIK